MSQFSRRSRWLNFLFPASKAPQSSDPGSVSDDVSLVQPYDGSGWGIPESSQWLTRGDSPVGITGDTDILTVPAGSVYRLFGAFGFKLLGAASTWQIFVGDLVSTPNLFCLLAEEQNTGAGISGSHPAEFNRAIVIPAGLVIRIQHFGGDVATQNRYGIYGCIAPIGTVFYC